jgi:anthranilate synthase/aminodeoxychorismate synthase-like glutamine amidotransferase
MSEPIRVVIVDNIDSFTYNLVDEFTRRGADTEVWRNSTPADRIMERVLEHDGPRLVVLSPGPGAPRDAGSTPEVIRQATGRVPLFGVCLGHQAIVEAFGGTVERTAEIVHGKSAPITHDGGPLFRGLPSPLSVGRYHSLVAGTMPTSLRTAAICGELVMALEHVAEPVLGVQFHPESILTPEGGRIIDNVLAWAADAG